MLVRTLATATGKGTAKARRFDGGNAAMLRGVSGRGWGNGRWDGSCTHRSSPTKHARVRTRHRRWELSKSRHQERGRPARECPVQETTSGEPERQKKAQQGANVPGRRRGALAGANPDISQASAPTGVAQATSRCRPATRRTEWVRRGVGPSALETKPVAFPSAGPVARRHGRVVRATRRL